MPILLERLDLEQVDEDQQLSVSVGLCSLFRGLLEDKVNLEKYKRVVRKWLSKYIDSDNNRIKLYVLYAADSFFSKTLVEKAYEILQNEKVESELKDNALYYLCKHYNNLTKSIRNYLLDNYFDEIVNLVRRFPIPIAFDIFERPIKNFSSLDSSLVVDILKNNPEIFNCCDQWTLSRILDVFRVCNEKEKIDLVLAAIEVFNAKHRNHYEEYFLDVIVGTVLISCKPDIDVAISLLKNQEILTFTRTILLVNYIKELTKSSNYSYLEFFVDSIIDILYYTSNYYLIAYILLLGVHLPDGSCFYEFLRKLEAFFESRPIVPEFLWSQVVNCINLLYGKLDLDQNYRLSRIISVIPKRYWIYKDLEQLPFELLMVMVSGK